MRPWYWSIALVPAIAIALRNGISTSALSALIVCVAAVAAWAEAVNDVFDRHIDRAVDHLGIRLSGGSGALTSGALPLEAAVRVCLLIAAVALASAATVSPRLMVLSAAGLTLGAAYSVPPLRLRDRPVLAVLSEALGYGYLAPLLGIAASNAFRRYDPVSLMLNAIAVASLGTTANLLDRDEDRSNGRGTLANMTSPRLLVHATAGIALFCVYLAVARAKDVPIAAFIAIGTCIAIRSFLAEKKMFKAMHVASVVGECLTPLILLL